jgi:hypothetical protein
LIPSLQVGSKVFVAGSILLLLAAANRTPFVQPQTVFTQLQSGNDVRIAVGNSNATTSTVNTYENPEWGISVQYPANWRASTNGLEYTDLIAFYSPLQNVSDLFPARLKVSAILYNQSVSLPDYRDFALTTLNESQQFRLINSTEYSVAGHPGHWIYLVSSPFDNDSTILHSVNIWTTVGKKLYLLTYDGEESVFNQYIPDVSQMLKSLQISEE